MTAPVLRPLGIGEVLDVSFGIYRNHFTALFTIAAVTMLLPSALEIALGTDATSLGSVMAKLGSMIIRVVLMSVGLAACTLLVSRNYLGHSMTAGEALQSATPFIGRLVAISMLTGLAFALGLVLLVIPGIIMIIGFMLSSAVAVIESPNSATDAMRRSWYLTRGDRFRLFITMMVPGLLLAVPLVALGILAAVVGMAADSRTFMALIAFGNVFFYPFLYVVVAVFYYDMRVRKEGLDLELMADGVTSA